TEKPHSESMNILCCQQWKTKEAVESELAKLSRSLDSLKTIVAAYNVFRYELRRNCTLDQAVFDTKKVGERHESLSLRFSDRKSLEQFARDFGDKTIPTSSKVLASFNLENPEAVQILRDLGRETEMPQALTCPVPDISLLDHFQE
ncbi:unnamed protein product, partial [marine sediment metagenome]